MTLWNASDPAHLTRITTASGAGFGGVSALAYSPDGHLLASASNPGTVVLRNVTDPGAVARIATITCHSLGTGAVAFGPAGTSWPRRLPAATCSPSGACREREAPPLDSLPDSPLDPLLDPLLDGVR